MQDLRMELSTGADCFNRVMSRTFLFHHGDVISGPLIYFYFYFRGGIYIRKPRNSFQRVSIAKVSLCDFFLSIQIIWEFTSYGLQEKTELLILSFYFMLIGNGKVLLRYSDTHTQLPLLAWAVNSHFPAFLHCERRKAGNCSFTAALIGGILDFPGFLRSEWRKTGNCSFTAAPIGGKVDFPAFLRSGWRKAGNRSFTAAPIGGKVVFPVLLRSERRKAGICIYAAGTCGGDLSIRFFILFSHLLLVGGAWVGAHFHKMKDGDVRITIG